MNISSKTGTKTSVGGACVSTRGKMNIYVYRMLIGNPKERDGFRYPNIDGKIILK
jgi:hypothetical protein